MQTPGTHQQQHPRPHFDHTRTEEEGEHWPLSENKPYFHYIIKKSHVSGSYNLKFPVKMRGVLPESTMPVVLTCRNKNWKMNYLGSRTHDRFDSGWRQFVIDNNLKVGDGCVFEFTEWNTEIFKIRVQILNGEIPSELLDRVDGRSKESPIVIE